MDLSFDTKVVYSHFGLYPRYERNTQDTGVPTTTGEKYTNLGCSPASGTIRLLIAWAQSPICPRVYAVEASLGTGSRMGRTRAYLDSFLGERFAVHPPLRFQYWLDYVSGFAISNVSTTDSLYKWTKTHAQIGICIGLSFVSMNKPASLSALTTATLA
jgi:hypothetical protein